MVRFRALLIVTFPERATTSDVPLFIVRFCNVMDGKLNEPDPFKTKFELGPPIIVPVPLIKPANVSVCAPIERVPLDKLNVLATVTFPACEIVCPLLFIVNVPSDTVGRFAPTEAGPKVIPALLSPVRVPPVIVRALLSVKI